ncbi:unnamed protein product [Ostreobium quekettii]|uniref:Uncharacterized protein n=1 Tax=Ostreobium quekettii TaxID=121088 RepID=A0A8S1IQ15_9CHLO|nr:unnamed protein product [Ostreobium quekettii]
MIWRGALVVDSCTVNDLGVSAAWMHMEFQLSVIHPMLQVGQLLHSTLNIGSNQALAEQVVVRLVATHRRRRMPFEICGPIQMLLVWVVSLAHEYVIMSMTAVLKVDRNPYLIHSGSLCQQALVRCTSYEMLVLLLWWLHVRFDMPSRWCCWWHNLCSFTTIQFVVDVAPGL